MNFLRFLLSWLVFFLVLAVFVVLIALIPQVQTWAAQWALGRQSVVQASFDGISAGFGKVEVTGLKVSEKGATLSAPSVVVRLPLIAAVSGRRLPIRGLTATGWTLDLSKSPLLKAGGKAAPEEAAAGAVELALDRLTLPCDVSVDGLVLEGDVLLPASPGKGVLRVHLALQGGGIAAGGAGKLDVQATAVAMAGDLDVTSLTAHGQVLVGMDSPRTLQRLEFQGSVTNGPPAAAAGFDADVAASREPDGIAASMALVRGGRPIVILASRRLGRGSSASGTWKVAFGEGDFAALLPSEGLADWNGEGEGSFEADPATLGFRAEGRLRVAAARPDALPPALAAFGPLSFDANFSAARDGRFVRIDSLNALLEGARPIASIRALRPFAFDPSTGKLEGAETAGDLLAISLGGLPLSVATGLDGVEVAGTLSGELLARPENGGVSIRSASPVRARGVAVKRGSTVLARDLDLSAGLALGNGGGWTLAVSALTASTGGRPLAHFDASATRPADGGPLTLQAKGEANLEAMKATGAVSLASRIPARSATADFTVAIGDSLDFNGKAAFAGGAAGDGFGASVHAVVQPGGTVSFEGPVFALRGDRRTEISVEGQATPGDSGWETDLHLTGGSLAAAELKPFAGLLAVVFSGPSGAVRTSDTAPFWGEWTGRVTFVFDQLDVGGRSLRNVDGAISVSPGSLAIEHAQAGIVQPESDRKGRTELTTLKGSLDFNPAEPRPYRLDLQSKIGEIESGPFFKSAGEGTGPRIEGRFTISASLSGDGFNRDDLVRRTRARLSLESTTAILRLLGTDVAESIPEDEKTTVGDTLGSVGSGFASLLGAPRPTNLGQRKLAKATDAVLTLNSELSEIGADEARATLERQLDGSIDVTELVVTAPDLRLTGTGRFAPAPGQSLGARPVSLDLQLAVRGDMAGLFSTAGLLAPGKDKDGFQRVTAPIRLGGSLNRPDLSDWTRLLAKAAAPPSAKRK